MILSSIARPNLGSARRIPMPSGLKLTGGVRLHSGFSPGGARLGDWFSGLVQAIPGAASSIYQSYQQEEIAEEQAEAAAARAAAERARAQAEIARAGIEAEASSRNLPLYLIGGGIVVAGGIAAVLLLR